MRTLGPTVRWVALGANAVLVVTVLVATFRATVAQAYRVDGMSMTPTLDDGDRVLVLKAAYSASPPFARWMRLRWADPAPGDVVVVSSPVHRTELVKRVVATEGQLVELRDGRVYVDGIPLSHDAGGEWTRERIDGVTYRVHAERRTAGHSAIRVPRGHVYVLGDDRTRSSDSRSFGPVPVDHVHGRVLL